MRFRPLGSPWSTSKVHYRPVTTAVRWCGGWVQGGVVPGVGYWVGTGWVLYRVLPTHPVPGIARTLVLPGPNQCQLARLRVRQALQAPAGPSAHLAPHGLRYPHLGPIRARFRRIYLKVSQFLECHHKMLIRPGILPVSKTGPKTTTLNS